MLVAAILRVQLLEEVMTFQRKYIKTVFQCKKHDYLTENLL